MAARFWVGGTGTWDATTTHWSATSGGAGGATVPTSADTVTFNAASNATAYTVTVTGSAGICSTFSLAGPTAGNVTFAGSGALNFVDSVTIAATGVTWTYTGAITFSGAAVANTVTTNGISLASTIAVARAITLGSALTTTGAVTHTSGTIALASFDLTTPSISTSNSTTRAITTSTGKINLTGTGNVFDATTSTGFTTTGHPQLTLTANTALARSISIGTLPTLANSMSVAITAGSGAFSASSNTFGIFNLNFTGYTGAFTVSGYTIYGSATFGTGMTVVNSGALTFASTTTGNTITTNGVTITCAVTFAGVGGAWALQDNLTSSSSTALTNGTLDFNAKTVNLFRLVLTGTAARTLTATGALVNLTGNASTILDITDPTLLTLTGLTTVNATYAGATGTRTIIPSNLGSTISFNIAAGSDVVTFSTTPSVNSINWTGFSGSSAFPITGSIYGSLTFPTSGTFTGTWNLVATSSTTITCSTANLTGVNLTFNGVGGTWVLQDAMTIGSTSAVTLSAGTLNLNGKTVTTGQFVVSATTTRVLAFSAGNIILTGNSLTVWSGATLTGFTYTGTSAINATYSGATGTRTISHGATAGGSVTTALNFNVSAGSDTLTTLTGSHIKNFNLSGFTGTVTNATRRIYGNWTATSGITFTAGTSATTFDSTVIGNTINTGNNTMDFPVTMTGVGGSWQLLSDLTLGAARALTLTGASFDAAGFNVSIGSVAMSGTNARTLALGSGTWLVRNSGTVWLPTATGLAVTGTATIRPNSILAKTFITAGLTWPTLDSGGTGVLTLTGAGTFDTISNTVSPTGFVFPAASVTTVSNFNVAGTAGNLVTIRSSTAGTRATLSKAAGTVAAVYVDIRDSNATGGAIWTASSSVDSGNNLGWSFGAVYAAALDESLTTTDALDLALILSALIDETITVSDASGSWGSDSWSSNSWGGLGYITQQVLVTNVDETTTTTDTLANTTLMYVALAESTVVSDALANTALIPVALSEATTITDSPTGVVSIPVSLSETMTITDIQSVVLVIPVTLVEATTVTDSFTTRINFNPALVETLAVTDATLAGLTVVAAISETFTLTEDTKGGLFLAVSISELATVTDLTNTANNTFNVALREQPNLSDVMLGRATFNKSIDETLTATDIPSATGTFNVNIQELITAADANFPALAYFVFINETLTVIDSPTARLLWELINDTQNADWASINNAQTPGWATIGTAQVPGWVLIPNTQVPGWNKIDDTQSPGWDDVPT